MTRASDSPKAGRLDACSNTLAHRPLMSKSQIHSIHSEAFAMEAELLFEASVKRRLLSLPSGSKGQLYGLRGSSTISELSTVVAFCLQPEGDTPLYFPTGVEPLCRFEIREPGETLPKDPASAGQRLCYISKESELSTCINAEVAKNQWLLHGRLAASDFHLREALSWYDSQLEERNVVFVAPNRVAVAAADVSALSNYAPSVGEVAAPFVGKSKSKGRSKGKSKSKGKKKNKPFAGEGESKEQGWEIPEGKRLPCLPEDESNRLYYGHRALFESIHEFHVFFGSEEVGIGGPTLSFEASEKRARSNRLQIVEVAVVAHAQEPIGEVSARCIDALRRQLKVMRESVRPTNWQLFFPQALPVPVVVKSNAVSAANDDEEEGEQAAAERKRLHELLGLGLDSPIFRRLNTLRNTSKRLGVKTGVLRSPHLGKYGKGHGVGGGDVYQIQGDFDYYHYTSNGYDDRGWGCAYRSFQMAFSWFRLAGFTERETPSVEQMQEKLHAMDVMDAHFYVGCKQWIGSQEVAWLLEEWIGVSCKFLVCSRGSELVEKARELASHFSTHQTPIVICGSNLALTLLGIAWNAESGKVSFLIADPHYTGVDDLETIQQKQVALEGYRAIPVTWRGPEAFSNTANYTLCIPLRPQRY